MRKGIIDNPVQLLIYVLIILAVLIFLFKFQNWIDGRPIKEKKKPEKKEVKTEIIKETVKEVVDDSKKNISVSIDRDEIVKEVKSQVYSEISDDMRNNMTISNTASKTGNCQNYLYDRFVVSPTGDDCVNEKETFDGFLTDAEAMEIRDRNIKVQVKDVEDISDSNITKDKLYKKIEAMANENIENKEKLLKEFESLPKSMKLLLIENIMQKM